jgi:hypothetical protein
MQFPLDERPAEMRLVPRDIVHRRVTDPEFEPLPVHTRGRGQLHSTRRTDRGSVRPSSLRRRRKMMLRRRGKRLTPFSSTSSCSAVARVTGKGVKARLGSCEGHSSLVQPPSEGEVEVARPDALEEALLAQYERFARGCRARHSSRSRIQCRCRPALRRRHAHARMDHRERNDFDPAHDRQGLASPTRPRPESATARVRLLDPEGPSEHHGSR